LIVERNHANHLLCGQSDQVQILVMKFVNQQARGPGLMLRQFARENGVIQPKNLLKFLFSFGLFKVIANPHYKPANSSWM
jgi:hypothetical protein